MGEQLSLLTRGSDGDLRVDAGIRLDARFRARYRLGRMLGAGAMGMVCEAEDLSVGRPVAVKFLIKIDDRTQRERFLREARLLARVRHPHVVRVLDLDEVDGHPFLAMEALDGGSLRERLARGPMPVGEALLLVSACLSGLQACHEIG